MARGRKSYVVLVTKSEQWYQNTKLGLNKGNTEVDFFTNNKDMGNVVDRVYIVYQNKVVYSGTPAFNQRQSTKDIVQNVFTTYQNKNGGNGLYEIGLDPKMQPTVADFVNLLNNSFNAKVPMTETSVIGNITVNVDYIADNNSSVPQAIVTNITNIENRIQQMIQHGQRIRDIMYI